MSHPQPRTRYTTCRPPIGPYLKNTLVDQILINNFHPRLKRRESRSFKTKRAKFQIFLHPLHHVPSFMAHHPPISSPPPAAWCSSAATCWIPGREHVCRRYRRSLPPGDISVFIFASTERETAFLIETTD